MFICAIRKKNLDSLKRKLKARWADFDKETMHACCTQVPGRLKAVIKAKGGYFE